MKNKPLRPSERHSETFESVSNDFYTYNQIEDLIYNSDERTKEHIDLINVRLDRLMSQSSDTQNRLISVEHTTETHKSILKLLSRLSITIIGGILVLVVETLFF